VTDIDAEKKRFVVTLRPSALLASTKDNEFLSKFNQNNLLRRFLEERTVLSACVKASEGMSPLDLDLWHFIVKSFFI